MMTKVNNIFFRISIGEIFEWKFFVYAGLEELAEITPFEPTIAPSKVFQCGLPIKIKSSCQLESINSSSSSCINVIHGQMRRLEKSSKSSVDDNCISEDDFDLNYSGDQA